MVQALFSFVLVHNGDLHYWMRLLEFLTSRLEIDEEIQTTPLASQWIPVINQALKPVKVVTYICQTEVFAVGRLHEHLLQCTHYVEIEVSNKESKVGL